MRHPSTFVRAVVLLAPALLGAAPATLYRNTFDDQSALEGWELSPGAEGGSVSVEDGRLALRAAPLSYRGARVALPLSVVLGRPGPFTAREIAGARMSWAFNISYENAPGGASNTGFRVYPLAASASPDTEAAAFYSLRGGIYADDRMTFDHASASSAESVPARRLLVPSAQGLPPAPAQAALRLDLDVSSAYPGWTLRLHRGVNAVDPERLPHMGTTVFAFSENPSSPTAFTHLVLEGQNGGAVWIDNLVVTTYDDLAQDLRGPTQSVPGPAGLGEGLRFGDAPVPLPPLASSGLPVTWKVSFGPGKIADGALHSTGVGQIGLTGHQPGDSVYQPASSHHYINVAPRALDIQISSLRQTYAGAPHAITATTSPPAAPLRITYDGSEVPPRHTGTYKIEAEAASENYTGRVTGLLVVSPAVVKVWPAPVTRLVGRPNPSPYPLVYEGLLGDDTPASIDHPPAARTQATASSRAGDYLVSLVGGSDKDYLLSSRFGTLTVLAFSGTYEAILTPPGQPEAAPLGKVSLTLSASRPVFSGTLWLASEKFARPLVGQLGELQEDQSVFASVWLASPAGAAELHRLRLHLSADTLAASLERGPDPLTLAPYAESWEGARRHVAAKGTPSPWSGRHTALLRPTPPAEPASAPAPRGPGHAAGDITASTGKLLLAGRLPDGTKLTSASYPDAEGKHRFFVRPHGSTAPNALLGRLDLVPHPGLAGRHHIPAGQQSLHWSRAPVPAPKPDTLYPQGYASLPLSILLDPWLPPAPAKRASAQTPAQPAITLVDRLRLSPTPALLDLLYPESSDFGSSTALPPTSLTLSPTGKALVPVPNPSRWKLTLNPARGTLTGSFVLRYPPTPPSTKEVTKSVGFSGVLRQPADADDPLVGAAQFIWTDSFHGLPRASDELLFTRPAP